MFSSSLDLQTKMKRDRNTSIPVISIEKIAVQIQYTLAAAVIAH